MATEITILNTKCTGEENSRTFPPAHFLKTDQSVDTIFREMSSGDIGVLANCKSLSVFSFSCCHGITGKFPAHFL